MRDLTDEEQLIITGANGDLPVSLETMGSLTLGALGASRGGIPGGFIGGVAGATIGRWLDKNGHSLGTIDPITINLPMNGTPSNHRYGGGFS